MHFAVVGGFPERESSSTKENVRVDINRTIVSSRDAHNKLGKRNVNAVSRENEQHVENIRKIYVIICTLHRKTSPQIAYSRWSDKK